MAEAATIEKWLARVEGRLEEQSRILAHPATKEDIASIKEDIVRLETRVKDDITRLEARIDRLLYLTLGSWLTLAIFIGGLYLR